MLVASVMGSAAFAQFPCALSGGEGEPAMGGPTEIQTGQFHDNSNFHLVFEVNEPCVLQSVKVFATYLPETPPIHKKCIFFKKMASDGHLGYRIMAKNNRGL